jgi:hypothetical protein
MLRLYPIGINFIHYIYSALASVLLDSVSNKVLLCLDYCLVEMGGRQITSTSWSNIRVNASGFRPTPYKWKKRQVTPPSCSPLYFPHNFSLPQSQPHASISLLAIPVISISYLYQKSLHVYITICLSLVKGM